MASKKLSILKSIGKWLLILVTVVAATALFFAFLAQILRPSFSHIVAFCGLFFFYIFLTNILLVLVWIFIDYRLALIPLVPILINVNNVDRHFQWHAQDKPETCANCIKVMSYNARVFGIYDANDDVKKRKQYKKTLLDFFSGEKFTVLPE